MPFARVNPSGYAVNAPLPSADVNQLDIDHSKTLNVTDGDQASPSAPVEFVGGEVRFKTAGLLAVADGGELAIEADGVLTVELDGEAVVDAGGTLTLNGVQDVNGTVNVHNEVLFKLDSESHIEAGAIVELDTGGVFRLHGATTPTYVTPSARTFTRTATHTAFLDPARWNEGLLAGPITGYYESTSTAGASNDRIVFAIDPPDGCTITSVSVWTDPPGGHGGEPDEKTRLQLFEQNVATGAALTTIFDLEDPATFGGGTYEPAHAVTQSGLSVVVDKSTKTYFVAVVPENGTNSVVGTLVWPPRFTFTRAKLGEE